MTTPEPLVLAPEVKVMNMLPDLASGVGSVLTSPVLPLSLSVAKNLSDVEVPS
jgi:hypothetical protein